jgi:hypothetical protein
MCLEGLSKAVGKTPTEAIILREVRLVWTLLDIKEES